MRPDTFGLKFRALFTMTCNLPYGWLMPRPQLRIDLQHSYPIGLFTSPAPGTGSYLYSMVLHILHTGHTDQGWVPAVHGLQLHVDQKAVWGLLRGGQQP